VFSIRSPYKIDEMYPAFFERISGTIIIDDDVVRGRNDDRTVKKLRKMSLSERFFFLLNHEVFHASRSSLYEKVFNPLYRYGQKKHLALMKYGSMLVILSVVIAGISSFTVLVPRIMMFIVSIAMYIAALILLIPVIVYGLEETMADLHGRRNVDRIEPKLWNKASTKYEEVGKGVKIDFHSVFDMRNGCRSCERKQACWKGKHRGFIAPYFRGREYE